jgi:membrane-bound metal-dependent hydrolase YbcI (DUF457 family)
MANRDEHDALGAIVGMVSVAVSASAAGRSPSFPELLGGAIGGVAGARLPDFLEPATNPHHRGPVHSVAAVAATGQLALPALHRAHIAGTVQADAETDLTLRFLRQVASGAMIGAIGGYASHVAADATTPMSIPLLGF